MKPLPKVFARVESMGGEPRVRIFRDPIGINEIEISQDLAGFAAKRSPYLRAAGKLWRAIWLPSAEAGIEWRAK